MPGERWAFQRQWLFYQTWGRLLYDPGTPDEVFARAMDRRHPGFGERLQQAYELASRVPLTLASLYDSRWDFTLYAEGMLALQGEITRYIGIDALINQPVLDPRFVSVKDYVQGVREGRSFPAAAMTPLRTADRLEADCRGVLKLVDVEGLKRPDALDVADLKAWANLGLHLAEKLRGAVELQLYRTSGGELHQQSTIEHLARALGYWDEVIRITRPIYKDMRLTHYNHNSFDANPDNLFHWALIRDEVAADVEVARVAKPEN
jgi:hypothetical protein